MIAQNLQDEENRERQSGRTFFGFGWLIFLPLLGTAIFRGEDFRGILSPLSLIGFLFSAVIIPLVFFGIYKLDKAVEKAIPKNWRDMLPNGEAENNLPSIKK